MGSNCIAQGAQLSALNLKGWDGGGRAGVRKAQEGRDMCVVIADTHCCTAETNTAL